MVDVLKIYSVPIKNPYFSISHFFKKKSNKSKTPSRKSFHIFKKKLAND